jgi:UDP-3-O-[3-hydroxymyristoyl] glucosamine N-acyltransferase
LTTLGEIAKIVNGSIVGNKQVEINGVSTLDNSIAGTITFIYNGKYAKYLDSTKASAIIANNKDLIANKNGIIVDNPRLAIIKVLEYFSTTNTVQFGIHDSAIIHPSVIMRASS